MKRVRRSTVVAATIKAATRRVIGGPDDTFDEEDDSAFDDFDTEDADDTFTDTLDDVADTVEDIQDSVDGIEEDDINIDMDNNIAGHYIAECDGCHGVFISATLESDQEVEKVSGVCPLCNKETDQYLKWVIVDVKSRESQ